MLPEGNSYKKIEMIITETYIKKGFGVKKYITIKFYFICKAGILGMVYEFFNSKQFV
jgi:hypothetical protein